MSAPVERAVFCKQEVSAAKNGHITNLLAQTDQCLQSLFGRLTASTSVMTSNTADNRCARSRKL